MSGPVAQKTNLADGRSMRRDVSRTSMARASSSRTNDDMKPATTTNSHGLTVAPRQRTAEDERARAAARQAEKEMWERTRGAGSSVFKLADAGRIRRGDKEGSEGEEWKAEDVLPSLEEVETKLYEIVEVPSSDVLLSRGICDYTLLPKTLGRGKFSTVFMATKGGELSAIKHTALFPHHELIATRLLREPTLLAELPPHPNLVAVKETIRTPGHFYLVEEYLGGFVTLEALLPILSDSQPPVLPIPAAEKILNQLISAVHSIHVPLQICHRDIKPENILVHPETLQLKLLDFGLATHYSKSEPKLSTCCGSPAFHCPEIVKALSSPPGSVMYMGPEVDAWTCGVTMLRCLIGQRFPLGASHSSLRGMAIRAQRAVATIGDEGMRSKVGALLDMDGNKRMKRFEELVVEQEKMMGEPAREVKKFKSTTFVPAEPTHSIKLPLLAPHLTPDISSWCATGSSTPFGPTSLSRRTTPSSSRPPSPNRSQASAPSSPHQMNSGGTIVALNPTHQPPERVLSYIKYCLRCAGILYHSWPDTPSNGRDQGSSPVNYFGSQQTPASQPASTMPNHAAFAEALGVGHDQASLSPVTPLFPSSCGNEERPDGYGHVQVFQCVMEVSDDKEQREEGGEQLSLVQSIMAAFGRKKPVTSTPSTPTRPENKRSLSTPAKGRGGATATGLQPRLSSKDGPARCLTFHLIVRFPKVQSSNTASSSSRLGPLRNNSSLNLAQQATSNSMSSFGRHARANSGGQVAVPSDVASTAEGPGEATVDAKMGKRISFEGHQLKRGGPRALESEAPGLEINTDVPMFVGHSVQAFPRVSANRSPSASRAPSRTRKRSHRGPQKKSKVFFQVTDHRALQAVRDALSVGGTIDSLEGDDYFSAHHHHRQSLPSSADMGAGTPLAEISEPLTPSRGDQRSKARLRASSSASRLAHSNSSTPRASDELTRDKTQRSSRFGGPDEEERRGRQLNGSSARGLKASMGGVRAPSQLSTVALKEESPNNDTFPQSIDSLSAVLQSLTTARPVTLPGTPSSGQSYEQTSPSNSGNSGNSSMSATAEANGYSGGETGAQMQARTLLMDISRRLHTANRFGASALEDLVSPFSFSLFAALSPALGLVPQETRGLPNGGGMSTEVGETATLRGLAMASLEVVAQCASPREMFLATQERLEVISTAGVVKTPSEDGKGSKELLQLPSGAAPSTDRPTLTSSEQWSSALETAGLMRFLSIVVPRIKTQKPDNFIEPLTTLVPRAVRASLRAPASAAHKGVELSEIDSNGGSSNPQTPGIENSSSKSVGCNADESAMANAAAGEVAFALANLTKSISRWVESFEGEEKVKAGRRVQTLFFACIIVIVPELPKVGGYASLSETHFYRWCPQYSFRPPQGENAKGESDSQPQVWNCFQELVESLSLDLEQCAFKTSKESLSGQDSSSVAIMAMGAFLLHVNLLSRRGSGEPPEWKAGEASAKLKQSMPLLVASLGAGPPATISADGMHPLGGSAHLADVALTWFIWSIRAINRAKVILDEPEILPALQTLSSHAALSPHPSSRLVCLTLVEALLDKNVGQELGRELLRDLVVESPFLQLRSASIGMAKRLVVGDLDRKDCGRYASRDFLQLLSSALFTLPGSEPPPLPLQDDFNAPRAYLDDNGPWLCETLGFIYLVTRRDVQNWTSVKDESSTAAIRSGLLTPLQVWMDHLTSHPSIASPTSKDEAELGLQLSLLRVNLDRASEAVTSRPA